MRVLWCCHVYRTGSPEITDNVKGQRLSPVLKSIRVSSLHYMDTFFLCVCVVFKKGLGVLKDLLKTCWCKSDLPKTTEILWRQTHRDCEDNKDTVATTGILLSIEWSNTLVNRCMKTVYMLWTQQGYCIHILSLQQEYWVRLGYCGDIRDISKTRILWRHQGYCKTTG